MARPPSITLNEFSTHFSSIQHSIWFDAGRIPSWLDDILTCAVFASTSTTQTKPLNSKLALGMLASLTVISTQTVKEYIQVKYEVTDRTAQLYASALRFVLKAARQHLKVAPQYLPKPQ